MSKEYAVYNWLTGSVVPAGDTLSGAEIVRVGLLEADLFAGIDGCNLEVVTTDEALRLRLAFTYGTREGRKQAEWPAFYADCYGGAR